MKKLVLLTSLIICGCFFLLPHTSAQCPNLNLSMGNFTNWDGYTGGCASGNISINKTGIASGRHTIMDKAQLILQNQLQDEICISIPKVPNGFSYSARLGNSVTGAQMEAIEYEMRVDSNNSLLMLHFAWVMEDPSHTPEEQPRFSMTIKDSAGNIIRNLPCAEVNFIANPQLEDLACVGSVLAKNWSTVGYSLEPIIGKRIKIYFETRDCTLSGHYGYAYVVAECRPMRIQVQWCAGQTTARFTAPDGFEEYTWTRSTKPGVIIQSYPGTDRRARYLNLDDPFNEEIVTCKMRSAISNECSAEIKTVVKKTTIGASFQYGVMEDGEVPLLRHNYQNWYDTCTRTATFVDLSYVINSTKSGILWEIHGINWASRDSLATYTFPDPGVPSNPFESPKDSITYLIRLTVEAENGCSDTSANRAEHKITIYASPRIAISGPTEMCQGETIRLKDSTIRSQFVSYKWTCLFDDGSRDSSTNNYIDIDNPGTFYLEATDVSGCIARDTHTVTHLLPVLPITWIQSVDCYGNATGGFTHGQISGGMPPYRSIEWFFPTDDGVDTIKGSTTSQTYLNLKVGYYRFRAEDSRGCFLEDVVEITQPDSLRIFGTQEATTCGYDNGKITVTATGGIVPWSFTVTKDDGSISVSRANVTTFEATGLSEGLYYISVEDANGCITSGTINVTAKPIPYIEVVVNTMETCDAKNGYIRVLPKDYVYPVKFSWDPGTPADTSNAIGYLKGGTYKVSIVDANGCPADTTIIVESYAPVTVSIEKTPETCGRGDGTITLTATSDRPDLLKYEWEGRTETTPTLTGLSAGTYKVTITDTICSVQETIVIPHVDGPIADFQTVSYSIPSNKNFVLTDISKGTVNAWNWDMGDGNAQTGKVVYHSYGVSGEYVVLLQVIDVNNCTDTISKVMHVYDEITVYIPNMFTPNGDDNNPVWKPVMTEFEEEGYQLSVFDRWGQRIFHTTDPTEGWDGTSIDGKVVASNTVYSYRMIVRDFAGQEYEFVGQVSVIR